MSKISVVWHITNVLKCSLIIRRLFIGHNPRVCAKMGGGLERYSIAKDLTMKSSTPSPAPPPGKHTSLVCHINSKRAKTYTPLKYMLELSTHTFTCERVLCWVYKPFKSIMGCLLLGVGVRKCCLYTIIILLKCHLTWRVCARVHHLVEITFQDSFGGKVRNSMEAHTQTPPPHETQTFS